MDSSAPEAWKPVVEYEGFYEVSDRGSVRSVTRLVAKGGGNLRVAEGRSIAQNVRDRGYAVVHLYRENRRAARYVHRLVLEAFVGPCPEGMEACHGADGASSNHLSNLRWDTHSENNLDQVRQGTHPWASKEACPLGHRLVEPNLAAYALRLGERRCLACQRARRMKSAPFSREIADAKYSQIMYEGGG